MMLWIFAALVFGVIALTYPRWATATVVLYRQRAGFVEHSVGVDGFEVIYFECGPKDAPALLLLHGFGGDGDHWVRFAPYLNTHFRIIAPDLPGFGRTGYIAGAGYTLDKQVARLRDFIETIKLEKFHLIGNSLGGYTAAAYSSTYPQKVLSLALFNSAGVDMPVKTPFYQKALSGDNQLLMRQPSDFNRVLNLVYHQPPWIPFYLKAAAVKKRMAVADNHDAIFQELLAEHASLDRCLNSIVAPCLILWGDDDRVLDISTANAFKAGIKHADIAIIPECGHLPMLEKPKETARMYLDFLRRAGYSPV